MSVTETTTTTYVDPMSGGEEEEKKANGQDSEDFSQMMDEDNEQAGAYGVSQTVINLFQQAQSDPTVLNQYLEAGNKIEFTFQDKSYYIQYDQSSGKIQAFNADNEKIIDSQVQWNNGLTVEGFLEIGGLLSGPANRHDRIYMGIDDSGNLVMVQGKANLDAHIAPGPAGSHRNTLLSDPSAVHHSTPVTTVEGEGEGGSEETGETEQPQPPNSYTEAQILEMYGQEGVDALKGLNIGIFDDGFATNAELAVANERLGGPSSGVALEGTREDHLNNPDIGELGVALLDSIDAYADGTVSVAELNLAVERAQTAQTEGDAQTDPETILANAEHLMTTFGQAGSTYTTEENGVQVEKDITAEVAQSFGFTQVGENAYSSGVSQNQQGFFEERVYHFTPDGKLESVSWQAADSDGNILYTIEDEFDPATGEKIASTVQTFVDGGTTPASIVYDTNQEDGHDTLTYFDTSTGQTTTITAPAGEELYTSTGINEDATTSTATTTGDNQEPSAEEQDQGGERSRRRGRRRGGEGGGPNDNRPSVADNNRGGRGGARRAR